MGTQIFQKYRNINKFFELFADLEKNITITRKKIQEIKEMASDSITNYFKSIVTLEFSDSISVYLISLFEGSNTRIFTSKVMEWAMLHQKSIVE
jgi:predicted phosphoadenosine phosphosulfate sulfurtransferase